jgi:hypothetical protein
MAEVKGRGPHLLDVNFEGSKFLPAGEVEVRGEFVHEEGDADLHGCMARGGYGLPKAWLGPTMPYFSTPCGWPPLNRPYSHFWGSPPAMWAAYGLLLPLTEPDATRLCRPACAR